MLMIEKKEFDELKNNVDNWLKEYSKDLYELKKLDCVVDENVGNIQHNYELIYDLKEKIKLINDEIKALKLIQLIGLKESLIKKGNV